MKTEHWKDIVNYEKYYEVSDLGRVRNKKTKQILAGDLNTLGYKRVILYVPVKKRFFVHRLVAMHFCDGYSPDLVVNHKDGNKKNNAACNLEWVTRSENDLHAYRNDLRHIHCPGHTGDMRYQVFDLSSGALIKEYDFQEGLKNDYGILSPLTVQHAIKRGWFFKNWHDKNQGKLGIRAVFINK